VVCFGKLSLSDIPIGNNQAASDRASAVAKVPSKWRGRRKRIEFRPCWRVKCGMSLHPTGNTQLRVFHRPIDLQMCWRFPNMQLCWWFLRRRWDQLCTAGTSHTKHQSSLNEGVFHVLKCRVRYRVGHTVFIWEQTATCATYSINWLVFITKMKSVYSAVRTGTLNKAVCA